MPRPPTLRIDLDLPAAERWAPLASYANEARELLGFYNRDLGLQGHRDVIEQYLEYAVSAEVQAELRAVAAILQADLVEVALGNLYYDALKVALGCTAFAGATSGSTLLARNLDWWSPGDALTRHTCVIEYLRDGTPHFRVVGWPGFIGCLSGVAPGRFAVTLNAVLSDEPMQFAPPVSLLLRSTLDLAPDFESAVDLLSKTIIPCDCLLMITGPRPWQGVVVERTPTRFGQRWLTDEPLVVTNSFLTDALAANHQATGELASTACSRLDRASALIGARRPSTGAECLQVLGDPGVQMGITVQQMVLDPETGTVQFP